MVRVCSISRTVFACFMTFLAVFFASIPSSLADDSSSRSRVGQLARAPAPTLRPAAIFSLDPSTFDLKKSVDELKTIDGSIVAIEQQIFDSKKEADKRDRIEGLRKVLTSIGQAKLLLLSMDSALGQQKDAANREEATVRQILGSLPESGTLNANATRDQLSADMTNLEKEGRSASDAILQDRAALKVIGGRSGDRLAAIDRLFPNPFDSDGTDKIRDIRQNVSSVLNSANPAVDVKSVPERSQDQSQKAPDAPSDPVPAEQQVGKGDDQADMEDRIEKVVDIVLRLYRNVTQLSRVENWRGVGRDLLEQRRRLEEYRSLDIRMAGMREEIARKQSRLSSTQETVNRDLEAAISSLGSRESFTLVATGIFGLAVVLVIGSFFVLAFRDRENRFLVNPDVGLQFVTLFSIIIAIILFGVLNILEGKELSALLGGLSGYILGRGSLGSKVGETDGTMK